MEKPLPNYAFWLKVMQISIIQMVLMALFASISYSADLEAQALDKIVTVQVDNQQVPVVLQKLEKQTDLKFVFSPQVIRSAQKVTIDFKDQKLGTVLEKLLVPLGIRFEVSGKYILLSDRRRSDTQLEILRALPLREFIPADINLQGKVTDVKGDVLPGVNVLVKGTQRGTSTNEKGVYNIDIPENGATLVFSFVGYLSQEIPSGRRSTLDVVLKTDDKALDEVVVVG